MAVILLVKVHVLTILQRAKTTKKVVLRLECTQCKVRFQRADPHEPYLTTGRPRHSSPSSDASTSSWVVTRRRRVLLLFSKRILSSLFCGPRRSHFWRLGLGIPNDSHTDGEARIAGEKKRMPVTIMDCTLHMHQMELG